MPPKRDDPERQLRALDLAAHLGDPRLKQRFVTPMFEVIARRYDRFTHLFSYGRDRRWKRELLSELAGLCADHPVVVDVGCGTGDLALGAQAVYPTARVIGFDVAHGMLAIARIRSRAAGRRRTPDVVAADMTSLPLANATAHIVTGGYAVRNAPTPGAAIDEIARVLRPGGVLLLLDFYRPRNAVWRALFLRYLWVVGNVLGWLWHGHGPVYGYIAASVERHVSSEDMCALLEARGFRVTRLRQRLFGGIALHTASLSREYRLG